VRISVADDGKGIASENLQTIWEPYVTNKPGGTGLGLAIARQAVWAHDGMWTRRARLEREQRYSYDTRKGAHAEGLIEMGVEISPALAPSLLPFPRRWCSAGESIFAEMDVASKNPRIPAKLLGRLERISSRSKLLRSRWRITRAAITRSCCRKGERRRWGQVRHPLLRRRIARRRCP